MIFNLAVNSLLLISESWSRPLLCTARFHVLQPRITCFVALLAYRKSKLFLLFVSFLCSRMCPSISVAFLSRFAQTSKR